MATQRLIIRLANIGDVPHLEKLDASVYEGESRAPCGSIYQRVATGVQWVFVAIDVDEIVGALYLRPIAAPLDDHSEVTWASMENGGDFSPPPTYQHLYGVGLVSKGGKVSGPIIEHALNAAIDKGITSIFFGSRIPTLNQRYPDRKPSKEEVKDYVKKGDDWEIKLYASIPFFGGLHMVEDTHGNPVIMHNYFQDPESWNYGVLWIWRNPHLSA